MNLQQLRAVRETSHQAFNLTAVAAVLHTMLLIAPDRADQSANS